MKRIQDPMGQAILDFWKTRQAEEIRVFSPMYDEDVMPVEILFRKYDEMPAIERHALDMATGRTLDVGAGAGCHSLVLQERGMDVTAIDISPLSVEAMKGRGVKKVLEQDFYALEGQYDTILLLMNGVGIVGTVDRFPILFQQLNRLLAPGGQVLCDSSDLCYIYEDEEGVVDLTDVEGYYGELTYQLQYKDVIGKPFPWVYVDAETLREKAEENGFEMEVVMQGEHYDYLAKLTRAGG